MVLLVERRMSRPREPLPGQDQEHPGDGGEGSKGTAVLLYIRSREDLFPFIYTADH